LPTQGIRNVKIFANVLAYKAEIEHRSNFENSWAIYEDVTDPFCKKCVRNGDAL